MKTVKRVVCLSVGALACIALAAPIAEAKPKPRLAVSDASVREPAPGATVPARFIVRLPARRHRPVAVGFVTFGGSARPGSDFVASGGVIRIPRGRRAAAITVPVLGDESPEPTERFSVLLFSARNAVIRDATGIGSITERPPPGPPALELFSFELAPGADCRSVGQLDFPVGSVQLNRAPDSATFVPVTSSNESAVTVDGGGATVPAGQQSATVFADMVGEGEATLTATLGSTQLARQVQVFDPCE